jgi:hypothetical protein
VSMSASLIPSPSTSRSPSTVVGPLPQWWSRQMVSASKSPEMIASLPFAGCRWRGGGGAARGIQISGNTILHVENCKISGFRTGLPGLDGYGIRITPSGEGTAEVYVTDTVLTENGLAASGGGILIHAQSGANSARVVLNRVVVNRNTHGIQANGTSSTGSIVVQVRDSVVSRSAGNGIWALTQAGSALTAFVVDRTSLLGNAGSGILAQGTGALFHIGNSTVVGNGAGLV